MRQDYGEKNKENGADGGTWTRMGLRPRDFHANYNFRCRLSDVCGLDYPFTLAFAVGATRLVSTPSNFRWLGSGLPSALPERFPRIWVVLLPLFPMEHSILIKSLVYTSSTTSALNNVLTRVVRNWKSKRWKNLNEKKKCHKCDKNAIRKNYY